MNQAMIIPEDELSSSSPGMTAALLHLVMEESQEGVLWLDQQGMIRQANRAVENLCGYPREELLGQPGRMLLSLEEEDAWWQAVWFRLRRKGSWRGEVVGRDRSGQWFQVELRIWLVVAGQGDAGENHYLCHLMRPVRGVGGAEEAGAPVVGSATDPLTGLPNRWLFEDRVVQALARGRRQGQTVALLLVDLDGFRRLNESLGYRAGDQLLIWAAGQLSDLVRNTDSVARVGADEFAILLTGLTQEQEVVHQVGVVVRKIFQAVTRQVALGEGEEVACSVAMGIALFPQDAEDGAGLIKNAETALGHAKGKGWNNGSFFSVEMGESARMRHDLEGRMRQALAEGQFCLYYQPQVSLESGMVIGAEALIRWLHPERGLVPPGEFIPVAEQTGLIIPIGEWVLREGCRQLARWRQMGLRPIRVGVNVSAKQLWRQDLAGLVAEVLAETGVDPGALDLELTESALMEDVDQAAEVLTRISAMGVHLSIDDFGTGHSSLNKLRQLPFKTLKLDRSFLSNLEGSERDTAIVRAIITMAHGLNQTVIAEGLETREQLQIMRGLACNEMQGFLFSRPLPVAEFTEVLRQGLRLE